MFFAIQPRCQNRPKMLPKPPQKLPSWTQNVNLSAIMAHLRAIVTHLGRNLPPTLPQLRSSCAHLRQNFLSNRTMYSKKCPKSAQNISSLQFNSIFDPSRPPFSSILAPSGYRFTTLRNRCFKSFTTLSKPCFKSLLSHSTVEVMYSRKVKHSKLNKETLETIPESDQDHYQNILLQTGTVAGCCEALG